MFLSICTMLRYQSHIPRLDIFDLAHRIGESPLDTVVGPLASCPSLSPLIEKDSQRSRFSSSLG